ncbi:MAG TPA: M24 family metallopeptidase, partial [Patescibacteria group bacterium]|nr:M24 family metallopeptidase [Patescibacteria group bacterium]
VIRGEKDLMAAVREVTGDRKTASDVLLDGFEFIGSELFSLHYPLFEEEISRYRYVGQVSGEIIEKVAHSVEPGQTETYIAASLIKEFADYGFTVDIMLVGSDDRISKYRHPNPSYKRVEKSVLLAPVAKKWGLRAIQSRMIHFGAIPEDIKQKQHSVSMIQAHMIAHAVPGRSMSELLKMQKELFKQTGYENEWKLHWQGSCTGYQIGNLKMLEDERAVVSNNMVFAWFTTITGAKSEETSLVTSGGHEILTKSKNWPQHRFEINGRKVEIPAILQI